MKALTVEAKNENIETVSRFIETQLIKLECPPKTHMQIAIAVDELFANIVNYAYPENSGKATIQIDIHNDPPAIQITFTDQGIPFNPLQKKEPDITLSAAERPIGGLGIFLVRKNVDEITYNYADGKNILSITKYL